MKEIAIDGAGRLVLPKEVRTRFRLNAGDVLGVEIKGDSIELKPRKAGPVLKKVNGVLVISGSGADLGARDLVAESREERMNEIAGGYGS